MLRSGLLGLPRDLLALAGAQCQHAPRAALPVFGGASGLTITQGIKGIQVTSQTKGAAPSFALSKP